MDIVVTTSADVGSSPCLFGVTGFLAIPEVCKTLGLIIIRQRLSLCKRSVKFIHENVLKSIIKRHAIL
jgi:hypothetical protein